MIDDLLQSIIKLSDEVKDIQKNSHHLYDLITNTEMNVNRVSFNILRLQQDIFHLDQKFTMVVELWKTRENRLTTQKAV